MQAFEFANLHAPDLKLIINQHGRFEEAAWEKIKELVIYLRGLDLRVDGIGWQAHLDLGWEKAHTLNFGIDIDLFKRLAFTVDMYEGRAGKSWVGVF